MKQRLLKVHPADNVIVALTDLKQGEVVEWQGETFTLTDDIAAKHKFLTQDRATGEPITMYGVLVGTAKQPIRRGGLLHTFNTAHATREFSLGRRRTDWPRPDVSRFAGRTFEGYPRPDGTAGTANYWVVLPMVFCENRNLDVMREALTQALGYARPPVWQHRTEQLVSLYRQGRSVADLLSTDLSDTACLLYTSPSPRD